MSHTNSTPNYSLPQWLSTDKPAWMADVNVAFSDIDTQMKLNSDAATAAQTTANNAVLNSAPGYSNVSTYQIGDVVTYQGRSYKCVVDITTPENWDGAKWTYYRLSDASEDIDDLKDSANIEYTPGVSVKDALDDLADSGWITLNSSVEYRKIGSIVSVKIIIGHSYISQNNWAVFGNLPSDFRPYLNDTYSCAYTDNTYFADVYISATDGGVNLRGYLTSDISTIITFMTA